MLLSEILAQIIAFLFQQLIGVVVSNFTTNILGITA
jgi:hypothetical protein